MPKTFVDALLELLVTVAAGVGSLAITVLGVLAEQAGLHNLAVGNIPLGVWETGMGLIILFVGIYLLGYNQFLRRIQRVVSA